MRRTTDTASLLRAELELTATWIESITPSNLELWRPTKVADIRRTLRKAPAAPVAASQPAGEASVAKPVSIACSVCYGSGYGIDGKPCPCGCRPAASAPAQPEAKGEVTFRQMPAYNGMWTQCDPACEDAVRFAPVPVAPAKSHIPSHVSRKLYNELFEAFDKLQDEHETLKASIATAADNGELPALTIGEAFRQVGGWVNGGDMGYPSFGSFMALHAYTVKMVESALADRARQAAIAQPSGAVPDGVVFDLNEIAIKSIHETYVEVFGPLPEEIMMNDILYHVEELIRAAAPQPPAGAM